MRARSIVVALTLVGASPVLAQPTPDPAPAPMAPTIATGGRVIDAFGKPVKNATVGIEGAADKVNTDVRGRFKLRAPIGVTLVIDHAGFDTSLATVQSEALDDIVLLTIGQTAETIEVKGEAPPETPGAAKLDRAELQRVPGTGGDIVRALTVMPGVVNLQLPIGYSGVVIRGSSPQDSKVLVDEFEIPVLFHNIGFRAVVPAESISSLDYIPGGFDVAFGRASSGIVALTTRPGDDKRSTQAEISLIDGGILAQGPIGDDTRYMIAFRRSTIDLVLPYLIPPSVDLSLTTVPSYYDEQFRIDHKLNEHWKLSLSSVGTQDTFELYATKDTDAATKRFFNQTRFIRLTAAAKYHDGPWSVNLAISGIAPEFEFDAGVYQRIDVKQPTVTPRGEVIRTIDAALGLKNVEWRAGGEAQVGRVAIDLALPHERREGETMQSYDPKDVTQTFHGSYWVPDFAAWTAAAADLDPRIRFTAGLRIDAFARISQIAPQPRAKLEVKLSNELTARLSSGGFLRPPEFQTEGLNTKLQAERSTQTIAGLEYQPQEGTRIQGSLYYTDRTELITSNPDGTLGNNGRGTTYGAELLATYRGGPWFAWLSYSYSHSTRVDHPGDESRLFSYDQPHSLNAAASWKKGRWTLGGRFSLYSGLPYTPARGGILDSDRNVYIPIYAPVNSARAPLHHQLDLRIDYLWHLGAAQMTVFLDVQNVYLNDSVVTYFNSYDYTQQSAFKSLPIIPSIGLRGVF